MYQRQHEWAVFFLIYADLQNTKFNNLDINEFKKPFASESEELKRLFNDILTSPVSSRSDIYIIYNEVNKFPGLKDATYLFKVINGRKGKSLKKIIKIDSSDFIQKPKGIINLLKKVDIAKYRKKMVITWDHGSIFGVFKKEVRPHDLGYEKVSVKTKSIYLKRNPPYITASVSKLKNRVPVIIHPCQKIPSPTVKIRDILTNEELADIIKKGIGKADILIMYNCGMMNLNTAFALHVKKSVDFFIAPQGGIDPPSYNFKEILKNVCTDPLISPFQLSRVCINTLNKLRLQRDTAYMEAISSWSIICLNLNYLQNVITLINKLSKKLIAIIREGSSTPERRNTVQALRDIRESLFPFDATTQSSMYMVDLRALLHKLSISEMFSSQFTDMYESLEKNIQRLLVDKFVGHKLYTSIRGKPYSDNIEPSGLSLFFPRNEADLVLEIFNTFIAENAKLRSVFFSKTMWPGFICRFMKSK